MAFKDIKELYSKLWLNFSTRGKLVKKDHLDGLSIRTNYDNIITRQKFKKVINVYKVPLDFDIDLDTLIINEVYEKYPKVDIMFNDYHTPIKVDVKNKDLIDEFNRAMDTYEDYKAQYDNLKRSRKITGQKVKEKGRIINLNKRFVDGHREKAESLEYVFKYPDSFFLTFKHIEISASTVEERDRCCDFIEKTLNLLQVSYQVLYGELGSYLANLTFTGYKTSTHNQSIAMLMSSENLASQSCYGEQGTNDSMGIYSGIEIHNNVPRFINFTESQTGQVIGILGKTGSGKTFTTVNQLLWHLGIVTHHVAIMDYKGGEYSPLLNAFPGIEIKMNGKYVNFLNLANLDNIFSPEEQIELFDSAVSGTVELFAAIICLKENEGSMRDLDNLVRHAIMKVLDRSEVIREQPHTYANTYNLKYSDVLDVMDNMTRLPFMSDNNVKLLNIALGRLKDYLLPTGSHASLFREEIDFETVLTNRLIIYNFNKNNDTSDFSVEDNIRFQMMRFLNNKKTLYIKRRKEFNVLVYEELQRSGDGMILREINHDVTGGRSSNKIVYLCFNSLNFLLTQNKDSKAVASNITTWIIGLIEKNEIQDLNKLFDVDTIEETIELIADDQDTYCHHFALKINTGKTVDTGFVYVDLPRDVVESDLFATRDVEE